MTTTVAPGSRPKVPSRGSKPGERRGGRKAGTPNKATANAREAFARLVEGNVDRVQGWLDQIAVTDGPKAALMCFLDLAEYHVPKLARTELTGQDGGPVTIKHEL
jgi:hypothetical protein